MTEPLPAVIPGSEAVPADLLAAFTAYETAIVANDLDRLDASFAPGPDTLRGDSAGLLVGHDVISAFRGTRGGVKPRVIERIEHRALGTDAALLVSVSRFAGGGSGLQTQLWQRIDGEWLITAAHVTPRAQALDRSVWRTVGDPLWQGAWEGPLAGLTVAVKDLFAIKGYRIGAGNPAYLDSARPEPTTAPAVSDLLRGGASLRGIARTDEFAYSIAGDNAHYGTPAERRGARARCPAARRAVPRPRSRPARPRSAWRPTPPARSACPRRTRACGDCAPRTDSCLARGCCRWPSPSTRSAGSPATARRFSGSRTGA